MMFVDVGMISIFIACNHSVNFPLGKRMGWGRKGGREFKGILPDLFQIEGALKKNQNLNFLHLFIVLP